MDGAFLTKQLPRKEAAARPDQTDREAPGRRFCLPQAEAFAAASGLSQEHSVADLLMSQLSKAFVCFGRKKPKF